ncbi:hypothetical protein K6W36_06740 [Acetobacter senegalensis]|uniref:hypothetical protein n=1 Tax=Acetobacter senegalensis TaxID=446692 RepID=UPI001EDB78B5|nr:hypothetical protein [Acetobacter senegalensis]MCG4260279.1 hypothetical protein [Acetobacter senegalensis]
MLPETVMISVREACADNPEAICLWTPGENYKLRELSIFEDLINAAFGYLSNPANAVCPSSDHMRPLHDVAKQFRKRPSVPALTGLLLEMLPVFDLHGAFFSNENLMLSPRPPGAEERWRPIKTALLQFKAYLTKNLRAQETAQWLDSIWPQLMAQADRKDHATREMLAGRAFFGGEELDEIFAIPEGVKIHEAA